jgi:penicillin amidase
MWQMDILRRTAQGRLAEVLGERAFERDLFCRTMGFKRAAEKCLAEMPEDSLSHRCLTAYCRGVNACVEEVSPDELPSYFAALDYVMEPWAPIDTVAFLRYVAWLVSGSFDDLWLLAVAEQLGADTADVLYPLDRPYELPVVPDRRLSKHRKVRSHVPKNVPGLLEAARDIRARALRTGFLQRASSRPGSNNWAVDGTKSARGKPVLCNDLHLEFSLPSVWYLAHLVADGLNVAGGTFPGVPGVIVGRNDRIAWGMTSTRADVVDYFYEKVHPKDSSKYRHKARWRRFETVEEEIVVREADNRQVVIESSVHGPVMTREGQTVTMQWTGHQPSDELQAILRFNSASNFDDFLDAVRCVGVPAQNFAYADDEGNVAIIPAGRFPVRKRGSGRVPHDGSSGAFDWKRFIPFSKLRYVMNPECHYVASANQRPIGRSYPYYLGWRWAPSYRARRINHLLAANRTVSVEDMKRFQLDVHDCAAEAFLPALFSAFQDERPEQRIAKVLGLLKIWDFKATPDSVATTAWIYWFMFVRDAIWNGLWRGARCALEDQWGIPRQKSWEPPPELLEQTIREQPEHMRTGIVDVPEGEALDELLRDSLRKAVNHLIVEAGEDMHAWKWGRFNRAKFESLARVEDLSRKNVPVGGTTYTLSPGGDSNEVSAGATLRFIAGFDRPDEMLAVYPGGQSQDGSSKHYTDLFDLWEKGEYVRLVSYGSPERFSDEETESVTVLKST